MAIKLIANYSKRLGLPGFSSHQFSVSIETELVTTDDVASEAKRIYELLQTNVDEQIQATGFVPPADYGMEPAPTNGGNARPNNKHTPQDNDRWRCSDKQRDLILKLVDEHALDKNDIDELAHQRFNKGVKQLNKIEASGLIDELLETYGSGQRQPTRRNGSAYRRARGKEAA